MSKGPRLSKKWFNPVYFHIRKYVDDPTVRNILLFGGKSSAKTFSTAQLFVLLMYIQRCSTIVYRKQQTTIKTTVKNAMEKAAQVMHMDAACRFMDFKTLVGTQAAIYKGLDREGKIKGLEGYKYLLFDELDQFSMDEYMQAQMSLRGIPEQKIFGTWNPISIHSWIKKDYLDKMQWEELPRTIDNTSFTTLHDTSSVKRSTDGKTILIKTTYLDNKWVVGGDGYGEVDSNLIDVYEQMKDTDTNKYRVNVLGDWGIPQPDRPYVYNFTQEHISDDIALDPNRPVYLSFDFNINPMTVTAHQFSYLKWYYTLYEWRVPNTGVAQVCDMIKASPVGNCHLIVTGDASGRNRSATSGNTNNYLIIKQRLGIPNSQIRVPRSNPSLSESRTLTNHIFALHPNRYIHKRCEYTIADLFNVEGDDRDKPKAPDAAMGHLLDGVRYMDNTFLTKFVKDSRYLKANKSEKK